MAPDEVPAHVSSYRVSVQGIDNHFQSRLILTAQDDGDFQFEQNNGSTWSKTSGRQHGLHNMLIPENLSQGIQVVGFIARLGSHSSRIELLEHPVGKTREVKYRSFRSTPDWISFRRELRIPRSLRPATAWHKDTGKSDWVMLRGDPVVRSSLEY